ncbi:hypothetical protein [Isoptericola sp. NPDC019482]|uniref:hypothetical protein n=1 Tax=Isoptericola sp. NPDC019482 TaxID=3154688 RepID=UPI0034866370
MRFLETILRVDPEARRFRSGAWRTGRGVGDGLRTADVAFYGPMVYFHGHDEEI